MSKVIEITDQNFEEEILNSDLPTEVDFWAPEWLYRMHGPPHWGAKFGG